MEAIALRKRWENLGLQYIFAPIRSFILTELPAQLPAKNRKALEALEKFMDDATHGLVDQERGYGSLAQRDNLNNLVKAEQALSSIDPILPKGPGKAKQYLSEIKAICREVREGRSSWERRKELHYFCKKALALLDQERLELVRESRPWV